MISRDYQNNWTNDGRCPFVVLSLNWTLYIRHLSLSPPGGAYLILDTPKGGLFERGAYLQTQMKFQKMNLVYHK